MSQPSESRTAGHEVEDADTRTLVIMLVILFASVAAVIGIILLLLHVMAGGGDTSLTAQQTTPIVPPAPRVQADPNAVIARLRAREDGLLAHYAWIDPAHTHARIPIDRAMALLVGHTLDPAP